MKDYEDQDISKSMLCLEERVSVMKSAIEKTDELLEQVMYCDFRTEVGIDKAKTLIRRAIKSQDRDTRRACSDAVMSCDEDMSGECIWKDDAISACMNAKAL